MSAADATLDATNTQVLSAILIDIGAPEQLSNFIEDGQSDDSILALSFTKPSAIMKKYGLPSTLAMTFIEKCSIAVDPVELATAVEFVEKCRASPAAQQQGTAVCTTALRGLNFQIISELGKGAFGTVFKCRNCTDKRTVAVKFVNDTKNSKEALREGQRLMNCHHPNIVCMHKVHDLGSGRCALEMELVSGGDLWQHLEAARHRQQRLPTDVVIRFCRQLLEALHYLHDKAGLIHGDIKPQNILVALAPPASQGPPVDYTDAAIKLADFGLAKTVTVTSDAGMSFVMTNASSMAGTIKGTMWYLSPEALQNASRGHQRCFADDLWSACLVILEMDTGLTLQQLMTSPGAININEMLTKASAQLLPLLFSVLASDSASRCGTASGLLHTLHAAIDPLYQWQYFEESTQKFVSVHAAAAFVLEKSLLTSQPQASLSLPPPLDFNFDIRLLLTSCTALGIQTQRSTGITSPIRRVLKSTVSTCGAPIPVWQELIDALDWRQCDPSTTASLESDFQKSTALPDHSKYRRVILQPHSIDNVQIPFPLRSEPYIEAANAADVAAMTARVHTSLPEWDISEMLQIVNPALQSKYADYRHRAAARCNGNPNERMLFHFAPDHVIPKIWQTGEGHDPRLSVWAEVGKGAYFSEHLMYGYAYAFKLWPSALSSWLVENEPDCGATMRVFASLVSLAHVADMGPGCETCPSDTWTAWTQEFSHQKSAENPNPKPTRPPVMLLPTDAASKQHLLDLMRVKDAPRYDSVVSSEGDLATHSASTNKVPSGLRTCDVIHPRLKERARDWGRQFVVFDTAASYPMFLITLRKIRPTPTLYAEHSSTPNCRIQMECFKTVLDIQSKALSHFSTISTLFMSTCPHISASTLTGVLQQLNTACIQFLTLRDVGVDASVLEFCFSRFRSLALLDVGENSALVSIHPSISVMTALKHLSVSNCSALICLPDELLELQGSLKCINARRCVSVVFPPRHVMEQGCSKIFQFLKDSQKSKPLKRVKVLFLGNARSGKTSFLHALAKRPLQFSGEEPDIFVDIDEHLKSGLLKSALSNSPELSYFDFDRSAQSAALELVAFHRQTVFVIFFSVMADIDSQLLQVLDCVHTIVKIPVCREAVRIMIVGTMVDLMSSDYTQLIKSRIQFAISMVFCEWRALRQTEIMFVTSLASHVKYHDLRRKFKDNLQSLSKSIFEGAEITPLRFPDRFLKVLASIDALKKKEKPGNPIFLQLQRMVDGSTYGELAGAAEDPNKLDALKMLHALGELVFIDPIAGTSPFIILKPHHVSRFLAAFSCQKADSIGLPKKMSRESIGITLLSTLMHASPDDALTLFDFLFKSDVLKDAFLAVQQHSEQHSVPQQSLPLFTVLPSLKKTPSSWKDVLGADFMSCRAMCLRGSRVISSDNQISLSSFTHTMSSLCEDQFIFKQLWTAAFFCKLKNDALCFVRLTDCRTIDVVLFGKCISQLRDEVVNSSVRHILDQFCGMPFYLLQLCPFCCALDSFLSLTEVRAYNIASLVICKCGIASRRPSVRIRDKEIGHHEHCHTILEFHERIYTVTNAINANERSVREHHAELAGTSMECEAGQSTVEPTPLRESKEGLEIIISQQYTEQQDSQATLDSLQNALRNMQIIQTMNQSLISLTQITFKAETALHAIAGVKLNQETPSNVLRAVAEVRSSATVSDHAHELALQNISGLQFIIETLEYEVQNAEFNICESEKKIKMILRACGANEEMKKSKKPVFAGLLKFMRRLKNNKSSFQGKQMKLQQLLDALQCTLMNRSILQSWLCIKDKTTNIAHTNSLIFQLKQHIEVTAQKVEKTEFKMHQMEAKLKKSIRECVGEAEKNEAVTLEQRELLRGIRYLKELLVSYDVTMENLQVINDELEKYNSSLEMERAMMRAQKAMKSISLQNSQCKSHVSDEEFQVFLKDFEEDRKSDEITAAKNAAGAKDSNTAQHRAKPEHFTQAQSTPEQSLVSTAGTDEDGPSLLVAEFDTVFREFTLRCNWEALLKKHDLLKNIDVGKIQSVMDSFKSMFTSMRSAKRLEHLRERMKLLNEMINVDDVEKVNEAIRDQMNYSARFTLMITSILQEFKSPDAVDDEELLEVLASFMD
jgi:serine/threonine protein kinase